jgi:DNA-binding XRE family transcriptional regulator
MKNNIRNLINRLEEYRLENRISQERLALMLGVSFATVNRWFKGHFEPNKILQFHIIKLLEKTKK